METLYLIAGFVWAVISIIMVVKFFQMTSDLRALKEHFIPCDNDSNSYQTYDLTDIIKGVIRKNGGIDYTITKGSVSFSDGKAGFIEKSGNKYQVSGINNTLFDDIYYAVEALYDFLETNK